MHLDPRTYDDLLEGTLPLEQARALADHLAGDCEQCERFLAERGGADALDGAGDAAIDRALPPRAPHADDLAFARIARRVRAEPARVRRALGLAAVAAALLVFAVTRLLPMRPPAPPEAWDGVKGGGALGAEVHLRYVLLGADGQALKGGAGDAVPRDASLVFELESDRSAEAALARVSTDGRVELVWRDRLASGRTVLGSGGKAAAYPLAGLSGRQRFVLLAGDGPLDPARVERAASALATGMQPTEPGVMSHDVVEVIVR
jgi:hypothetical protein